MTISLTLSSSDDGTVAPDIFKNNPVTVTIDKPSKFIKNSITSFEGWIASSEAGRFNFYVNGSEVKNINIIDREDIKGIAGRFCSSGWQFYFDVLKVVNPQNAICLEVRLNERVVHQSFFKVVVNEFRNIKSELIFFIHMPKTGGTSIRTLMQEQPDIISMLNVYEEASYIPTSLFSEFSSEAISKYDVIFGHFKYGIHGLYNKSYKYITLLRNPYDFIKSFYFFQIHNSMLNKSPDENDIFHVLRNSSNIHFDNFFTRVLAAVPDDRQVVEEDYLAAIDNIERDFIFIGLTEYMAETKRYIGKTFGVDIGQRTLNRRPASIEADLVDPSLFRKAAQPCIHFDLSLYEFVLNRFWGVGNAPK